MPIEAYVNQFEGGVSEYRNPTAPGVANYLYWLCGKFALEAEVIYNGATGGGNVSLNPLVSVFPFAITSSSFEPDGVSYNNPDIVGSRIMIFINQWSQQWFLDTDGAFIYTSTGIKIILPGFNANTANPPYTIIIQKDNTA